MSPKKITDVSAAILSRCSDVPESDLMSGPAAAVVSDDVARIFEAVAWRVLIGWCLAFFVLLAVQVISVLVGNGPLFPSDQAVWVSLGSGLVCVASLVPGLVIGRGVSGAEVERAGVAIVSASSAIGIRFAGTVALFVACRYHFGEESLPLIFLVIGWYVFLTSIEVHGLARGLVSMGQVQKFDRRNS